MPTEANDTLASALAQHRAGNLPSAEQLYRQVLAQTPESADAWHLLGALCLQAGRETEAVDLIRRAIALDASKGDYYSHLGAAYGALGDHLAAVAHLKHAVRLAPQSAMAHYNLGTALRNDRQLEAAVASFRHAIAVDPQAAEAHYNLANALRDLGQLAEAEASYRQALRVRPKYAKALINLGNVLADRKRYAEAIDVLRAAVDVDPNYSRAHLNLGSVLRDWCRFDDAIESLSTAVALDPKSAEAHNSLGTALQARAQFDEARACYQSALALDPELPDAHFSRAIDLLRQGELAEGFTEYEWRWRCKSFSTRRFAEPRWDRSPLAGRTILLHAEQGLGDAMHFIRYAADVKRTGGTVIVECQKSAMSILAACEGIDQFVAAGSPLPPFDVHCPLLSLPGVLGLSIDRLARGAYLSAEPKRVDAWRQRLADVTGFRVGICWAGNPENLFDPQRSFALSQLAAVARIPSVRLVSLQKGPPADEIACCSFDVVELGAELDADGAFLDTAAAIKNLDLVLSADTAVAHLAGAMETPVWVPLSAHGDWRWFTQREDSPWYPSLRLFRQARLDQWDDVFVRIASELQTLASRRS